MYHQILYKRKKKNFSFIILCSEKDRMAGTAENVSSDLYKQNESVICVALCLGKVFFLKEKK
jgi:hypothetical protein